MNINLPKEQSSCFTFTITNFLYNSHQMNWKLWKIADEHDDTTQRQSLGFPYKRFKSKNGIVRFTLFWQICLNDFRINVLLFRWTDYHIRSSYSLLRNVTHQEAHTLLYDMSHKGLMLPFRKCHKGSSCSLLEMIPIRNVKALGLLFTKCHARSPRFLLLNVTRALFYELSHKNLCSLLENVSPWANAPFCKR